MNNSLYYTLSRTINPRSPFIILHLSFDGFVLSYVLFYWVKFRRKPFQKNTIFSNIFQINQRGLQVTVNTKVKTSPFCVCRYIITVMISWPIRLNPYLFRTILKTVQLNAIKFEYRLTKNICFVQWGTLGNPLITVKLLTPSGFFTYHQV